MHGANPGRWYQRVIANRLTSSVLIACSDLDHSAKDSMLGLRLRHPTRTFIEREPALRASVLLTLARQLPGQMTYFHRLESAVRVQSETTAKWEETTLRRQVSRRWVALRLWCIIANLIPARLLRGELMELVPEVDVDTQRVCCDRKSCVFRQNFAKGSSADFAETATIFVRQIWFVESYMLLPLVPFQVLTLHKNNGAGSNFSAPGAVACSHHGRHRQQLKFYSAATTASLYHDLTLPNSDFQEQYRNAGRRTRSTLDRSSRLPPFSSMTIRHRPLWDFISRPCPRNGLKGREMSIALAPTHRFGAR